MNLFMCEQKNLEKPNVTISYSEMTESIKRVADFVRSVDQTILCKKDSEECVLPVSDIFYVESVDKKGFIYGETEVFQSNYKLYEMEEMLPEGTFVRVSKSTILNIEKLTGVKTMVNSKLEAILSNGERICVTRKYLKNIKEALLRRNGK